MPNTHASARNHARAGQINQIQPTRAAFGNEGRFFLFRQIPAREFSRGRRTILLLRGEKAVLREDVKLFFDEIIERVIIFPYDSFGVFAHRAARAAKAWI